MSEFNNWNSVDKPPKHKDLVLVDCGIEMLLPAIYYNNPSFKGFYKFTTRYHSDNNIYFKVPLKEKHKLTDVKMWMPLPVPPKQ